MQAGPEEAVSHGICQKCEERMATDRVSNSRHPADERCGRKHFKPPPPEEFRDWTTFAEGQLLMGFTLFIIIFLVVMAAEGLHHLTGGKTPELIEWQPKKAPLYGNEGQE